MKPAKCMAPVFLLLLVLIGSGCTHSEKEQIRNAIDAELGPLKNLTEGSSAEFIPSSALFTDSDAQASLQQIREISPLFFRNFDYSVKEIQLDKQNRTAQARLELTTIDAESVAKDFSIALLKASIKAKAKNNTDTDQLLVTQRYQLLKELLMKNDYGTGSSECMVSLLYAEEGWRLVRTQAFENLLTGGLMTFLSDPDLLQPADVVSILFDTMKEMSHEELAHYLQLDDVFSQDSAFSLSILSALLDQVEKILDYKIQDTQVEGYNADVQVVITSYDADAILAEYHKALDDYLNTTDAVMAGEAARREHAAELLLSAIEGNTAQKESTITFTLINDGTAWIMKKDQGALGEALFGAFAQGEPEELTE